MTHQNRTIARSTAPHIAFYALLFAFITTLYSCSDEFDQVVPEGFVTDCLLRMTPVKDQGKSSLCWAFAMLATIETEHLEQEDSINLSTDYIARMMLKEQAHSYFLANGDTNMSMRGIGPMLLTMIRHYGILPYDSYYNHKPVNYNILQNKLKLLLDRNLSRHRSWKQCERDVENLLDHEIGWMPKIVFMLGAEYTPLEFAHSVHRKDEYLAVTSSTDNTYGKLIDPQLTDNQYNQKALNVPADTLVSRAIQSISYHHPVFWEGGPNDNHAVAFVGFGHDKHGRRYFIAKNSWGDSDEAKGLLYIPVKYVKRHTALIVAQSSFFTDYFHPHDEGF